MLEFRPKAVRSLEGHPTTTPVSMSGFATGLCECCAQPGGCGLCVRNFFCPCTVVGDINAHVGGPCGFVGGCLPAMLGCHACVMCFDVPQVAEKSGFEEGGCKACICATCPLTGCCYVMQVHRECQIQQANGVGKPMQEEMK